jgi:hypothetical protein
VAGSSAMMGLPLSRDQFRDVFGANTALWPAA